MHQLKPYSKNSSKASKPKPSKTLNASDTFFKLAGNNDFYRASKFINDSSHYEPSIEFDIEDQGVAQPNKFNNEPVSKEISTKKMSRHPRNFSLPEISNIHHLSSEKAPVSGTIHELVKKVPVSQSISGQDQLSTYNELAGSQRGSSLKSSRVLNPSLTSLHPKDEVNPQHLRALEKLIVTQGKIEKKRQLSQSQSQKGILVKRDISHLSNSASKANANSVIFVESQTETPKMRPERLYIGMANNSNGKMWTPDKEKENQEATKTRRQATSISEIGRGLPSSQSLEKSVVRRNTINANKSEVPVDPIASFLDKVKNENEEKSSTKREKAKKNYRTPRRNVTDLHFALSSARMQLQENIIAEENENTHGDKSDIQVNNSTITANPSFHKLYNHNISHEKLTPSEYLLHSGKKLTGLGTATGPCVPKIWGLAGIKNMGNGHEHGIDNDEKSKSEVNLLIADLKKHVPTAMSKAPPSRQDAIGLNEWLEGKIDIVIKGGDDDIQKLAKCDTLYNLAVNEIIRQVSIDCGERGETLYHIWWNYLKMFAQFKQRVHFEDEKLKEACLKESQRQQHNFNEILFRKDSEIEKLKADILKLEDDKKAIREKCERAISKKTKYHHKVDDMKKLLDRTKEIVQELRAENEAYARRLNRKLGPNGKPGHVPLYLAHHRPTREDEGDSLLRSDRETIMVSERATQEAQDVRGRMSIAKSMEKAEKKVKVEGLDTSSDDSDESSEDFAYENLRVSNRPTYMNNNVVTYRGADKTVEDHNRSIKIFAETKEIEVQTELQLVESKYDEVLESQKTLEELLAEHKLKQEVGDILNEAENIPEESEAKPEKSLLTKSFSWYSLSHKSLVEDRIDGIGKFSMEKKKVKKHKGSFRSLKALKSSSGQSSEQNSPSAKSSRSSQRKIEGSKALLKETVLPSMRKSQSVTDGYLNPEEDKRQLHDKLFYQKTSNTLGTESEMSEVVVEGSGRVPSLKIFPSIEEQEEGRSTQRSHVEKPNTLGLKPLKPNLDDLEDGRGEIERTSEYNSLTQDALGNPSIDEGLDHCTEEDTRTLKPSRIIEKDFPETPIRRNKIPSFSRDLITDSGPVTPKSYNTDDLFQNLEDSDSDNETDDEVEERHESMAIIEEAAEEDKGSPLRDYSRKRGITPQGEANKEIRVEPVATEQNDMPKLSMATIVKLKLKASRVVNTMRKEEASPMVDKAKLMTVTRMYKVEKEKNSLLQKTISELEEQLINEKKTVNKGEETISDLRLHIKLLEDLKERCPHGKCEVCIEEHAAEMKAEQEECFTMGQDTLNMFYSSNGDSKVGELENECSESGKAESRVKRLKKKLKSQQTEFGRRKEKEQKEKFVVSVIEKVKEKKLAKFKNFTPLSGVLKQITCLYNDRIAQGKENASLKDELFSVYVYNWFIGNFGLRKIAEQKFVSFALSIKKHIHVVRVNMFARFLGLLEGPVNYSFDETNKYLECLDFINNSSLGTTIVNQETDTKHYAPFLRGLDYIKHFAEGRMPLEEYTEFRQEFEALKETDPKNVNKNGIVDIDLFMAKILTKYRIISNRTKQFVVNAFKAGDLDNNKYCSLKEFVMIYRYIEPQKFDISSAENLFNEKADTKIEGQLSLSFDKFTIVCVEYGLFSDIQQDLFLGLEAQSLEDQVKTLQDTWVNTYDRLNRKIKGLEQASQEEKQYWLNVLENVHDKIFKAYEISLVDLKPVLMAYKMMDLELERLKQLENKVEKQE